MRGRVSPKIGVVRGLVVLCGLVVARVQQENFFSEWRPNPNTRGVRYVGNKACVECHKEQAQQLHTPMAQALEVAPDCGIVTAKGKLSLRNGPYTYSIAREGASIVYRISDGKNSISKPVLYCFGQGHVGQTFLFRINNIRFQPYRIFNSRGHNTTCHMPKVELQGMHAEFTDHWIRIAKPNEPIPR